MIRGLLLMAVTVTLASGCSPSNVRGPLAHQEEERDQFIERARRAGLSTEEIDKVMPPLTPEEKRLEREQDSSCRGSYMWKNALVWAGGALVATAAGFVVGGAIATGSSDSSTKVAFGISAGTIASLGGGLGAVAAIIQGRYSDRGCGTKIDTKPDGVMKPVEKVLGE
ncbi:MAG TPA: hypothetical protein VIY73_13510 [Polyangiaceae bacterium]